MKRLFTLYLTIILTWTSFGQNKIILKKGSKRESIKKGQLIGVTLKGEDYKFSRWTDICDCGSSAQDNFWLVDSISKGSIGLVRYNYKMTYRFDTLTSNHVPKGNDHVYIKTIPSTDGKKSHEKSIYKISYLQTSLDKHLNILYDSLDSFTLFDADIKKCVNNFERIKFNYPNQSDSKGHKNASVIIVVLAVFAGVIVESTVNTTKTVAEKISNKRRLLHRYMTNEWRLSVR